MDKIYLLSEEVNKTIRELIEFGTASKKKLKVKISSCVPMIMFSNLDNKELGHYDMTQNLIVLSTELLGEDIAEIRKNIYLHELAHWADVILNGSSAHDDTFKEICSDLGVDEDYSRATVKDFFEKRDKIRSKVEKLIALSSSDFEGEATSAIEKAQSLMEKYNIRYTEEDSEDEIFGIDVYTSKRMDVWRVLLLGVISDITGTFHLTRHVPSGKTLSFYGSAEQVESALYLWEQLTYNIDSEYKKIKEKVSETVRPAEIHNGIVLGLRSKVAKASCKSLVLSKQKNEKIYCRITGIKISHTSIRSNQGSQFRAGISSGSAMDVPSGKGTGVKRIAGH